MSFELLFVKNSAIIPSNDTEERVAKKLFENRELHNTKETLSQLAVNCIHVFKQEDEKTYRRISKDLIRNIQWRPCSMNCKYQKLYGFTELMLKHELYSESCALIQFLFLRYREASKIPPEAKAEYLRCIQLSAKLPDSYADLKSKVEAQVQKMLPPSNCQNLQHLADAALQATQQKTPPSSDRPVRRSDRLRKMRRLDT